MAQRVSENRAPCILSAGWPTRSGKTLATILRIRPTGVRLKGASRMDDTRPTRLELLARLDLEEVEWKALLAEFGEDRMEIPGVTDDWTFKDVAAHLNGWRQPH